MTTMLRPAPVARDSARTAAVVTALAPRLGLKPGSCHQHVQRIRRELPLLVEVARRLGREAWLEWFFAPVDAARLRCQDVADDLHLVLTKGAIDRTEDGAREAYLESQDLEHAREFDARLEKEQIAIATTRRFLHLRHPELRPC